MLLRITRIKIGPYGFLSILIIALATLLRISLIALGWPHSNADEGTMGLMAMHILNKGEHPIFFYGQHYMGTLEAYLGSVFFYLFGISIFSLRLGPVLFFSLFLVNMYLLTSLLYTKKFALITLIILTLGSSIMLDTELVALGGYPELLFFGSLSLLLSSWLALSHDQYAPPRKKILRLLVYTCWGLVCGLGFWSDFLMLGFILLSGLFLLLFCWKEILKGAALFLVLGLAVGAFPLIVYNLKAPPNLNTLTVLKYLHNNGSLQLAQLRTHDSIPYGPQLRGTLLTTLPAAIGGSPFCFDAYTHFRLAGYLGTESSVCSIHLSNLNQIIIALSWSLGFITLWSISTFSTIRHLWKILKSSRGWSGTASEKKAIVRNTARLMLLCSAALTLYLYISSPISAAFPTNSRYLIGLLISTPALIWPLWGQFGDNRVTSQLSHPESNDPPQHKRAPFSISMTTLKISLKTGILALIGLLLLFGTINTFLEIPTVQAYNRQQDALIHELTRLKINHFYTEYWTCDSTAFLSKDHIICSSIDNALRPHYNRYLPYISIIKSDPNSAYVFPQGASQIDPLIKKIAHSAKKYQRLIFDGYVIYKPVLNSSAPH
ncbi:MAG: hypothetical protein ACXVDN_09855 [Ktedonobacteraceae bacterium]